MSKWSELPISERHLYIRAGVRNGITSLSDIKDRYNKFAEGGEIELEEPNILGLKVPGFVETAASFVPILGSAMDIREAFKDPSFGNIALAALSVGADLAGASLVRGAFKGGRAINRLRKAEKEVAKLSKTAGKTEDYSRLIDARKELDEARKFYNLVLDEPIPTEVLYDFTKGAAILTDFKVNLNLQIAKYNSETFFKMPTFEGEGSKMPINRKGLDPYMGGEQLPMRLRPEEVEFYNLNKDIIDPAAESWRNSNQYADGGITDSLYIDIMEKVANENWQRWGYESPYLAFHNVLNDNTYDYRGYYNKYPNSRANADTHWTDEFKTVYHPTFSDESRYSPNNKNYVGPTDFNPNGIPGGHWIGGDFFVPSFLQVLNDSNIRL